MSVTIIKQAKTVYDYYRKIFSENIKISPLWDYLPIFDSLNTLQNNYKPNKTSHFFTLYNQEYLRRILDDFPSLRAITHLLISATDNEQDKTKKAEEMHTMNDTLYSLIQGEFNTLQKVNDQVSQQLPSRVKSL